MLKVGDAVFRIGSSGLNTPGVYGIVTDIHEHQHGTDVGVRADDGGDWWGPASGWTLVEHSVRVGA